jgi:1-deoxy-D-xylulose-5-phosphate reductoisomerase
MPVKRVAILGSTGSVGTQALQVVERHSDRLAVTALAAGDNDELLAAQVRRFAPAVVAIATPEAAARLRERLGEPLPEIVHGRDGLLQAATGAGADVVVNAVVGAAGLTATHEAVRRGISVALANKESLVMAGELIMATARASGAAILPVDSEPNALHQCLRGVAAGDLRRLVLTASGGPFRGWSAQQLDAVTPASALRHPTWQMGPRISVDSATLMNKGFEVIETCWLFGVPIDKIDVVIHPQSIIHSLIELVDGSLIAHAGPTDMRLPIQDALSYPERWEPAVEPLDLIASGPWSFEPADPDRYPALRLAREAMQAGGTAPAFLNAADEVAVAAFLDGALPFRRIVAVVAEALESAESGPADALDAVFEADRAGRRAARAILLN